MPTMQLPMGSERLGIRPPLPSQIPVAEQVVQTLAQLLGHYNGERVVLKASPGGILYSASPALTDVFHWTAAGANDTMHGDNIVATEVLCIAHPDNTGKVWVRTKKVATVDNAIPLDAGDIIGFSVENLQDLQALIVVNGEKLIVGYSL